MLQLIKSRDIVLVFTWEAENGTPCDITSTEMIFTVKTNQTDADPGVLQEKWHPVTTTDSAGNTWDTTKGQTTLTLTASQINMAPGSYWWDIQVISGTSIYSNPPAQLQVIQNITTATS